MNNENEFLLYIILLMPIALFLFTALYIRTINPFLENRKYIKLEIYRSCSDKERAYWERKLKNLYVSSIPFVGKFIAGRVYKKVK